MCGGGGGRGEGRGVEDLEIFLQKFCNPCYAMICQVKKMQEDCAPRHAVTPMNWTPHNYVYTVCGGK